MSLSAVSIHSVAILLAFAISFFILFNPKGTKLHKILGWLFVILMFIGAVSSFWLRTSGQFSIIHLLSIFLIYWLIQGVLAVRLRKANWRYKHAVYMANAYISIIIAGSGVIVRHYIVPGDRLAGEIASIIVAAIAIPWLIKIVSKYK
jgi:uncharacterized membrane protein